MLCQNVAGESTKACLGSPWSVWDSKKALLDKTPYRYRLALNIKFYLNFFSGLGD
jgi:hypothetical protein